MIDDPSLMLDRSLQEVSDFLEIELNEKLENDDVPLVGMSLDGLSEEGVAMRLEVRLSVRGDGE